MSEPGRVKQQIAHRRAFGDRVRTLRRERNWTQEVLAERADVGRSYLAALEGGGKNPSLDVIVRLANALHVSPDRLLT
jgi:transcriptional regulator with XRE-family HTH domain